MALTASKSEALALRTPAGWLLPAQDKRPDTELPDQIHGQLASLASDVQLVHEGPLLGSPGAATDEFYFLASIARPTCAAGVAPIPVDDLLQTPALFPIQRAALAVALSRERTPTAPFDSAERVHAELAWALETAAHAMHTRPSGVALHRCARHEYVARIDTPAGVAYFKGGSDRVDDEGSLTQLLWTVSPDRFPCTLAVDQVHRRWLYRELEGGLLVGSRLTRDSAIAATRALADLQKRLVTCRPVARQLARRSMDARALFAQANALVTGARPEPDAAADGPDLELASEWLRRRQELVSVCESVDALGVPLSLVLSDFWGRNVLETTHGIGFIDLEHSYWSCPMLPLWKFLHLADQALRADGALHAPLLEAFIDEWAALVAPERMRSVLKHLPLLGRLFNLLLAQHDLERLQRELGEETPLSLAHRLRHLRPYISRVLETPSPSLHVRRSRVRKSTRR